MSAKDFFASVDIMTCATLLQKHECSWNENAEDTWEKWSRRDIYIILYNICVCVCYVCTYVRINEKLNAVTIACKIKNLDGLEICIRDWQARQWQGWIIEQASRTGDKAKWPWIRGNKRKIW